MPDISGLINKTDHDNKTKLREIFHCCWNKTKIKQKNLINESNISDIIKSFDLNIKIESLATKAQLKAVQGKIVTLQTRDLHDFLGKNVLVMMVFRIYLFINQHLIVRV